MGFFSTHCYVNVRKYRSCKLVTIGRIGRMMSLLNHQHKPTGPTHRSLVSFWGAVSPKRNLPSKQRNACRNKSLRILDFCPICLSYQRFCPQNKSIHFPVPLPPKKCRQTRNPRPMTFNDCSGSYRRWARAVALFSHISTHHEGDQNTMKVTGV